MRSRLGSYFAICASALSVAGASLAETPPPVVPLADPLTTSQARAVIQAQIHAAPAPAPRMSGTEAGAIYKRYIGKLGQPMVQQEKAGYVSGGGSSARGGG